MKTKIFFLLTTTIAFTVASCTHPSVVADSPAVSFYVDVEPVLNSNCANIGCHDANAQEVKPLITYDNAMQYVKTGDANHSKLYEVLNSTGENQMPPNGSLTDLQKQLIFVWIAQGAKNN